MAKKGKKGKGKGDKKGPELITTRAILRERERCMCPRLGDAYTRASKADEIRTVRQAMRDGTSGMRVPALQLLGRFFLAVECHTLESSCLRSTWMARVRLCWSRSV